MSEQELKGTDITEALTAFYEQRGKISAADAEQILNVLFANANPDLWQVKLKARRDIVCSALFCGSALAILAAIYLVIVQ